MDSSRGFGSHRRYRFSRPVQTRFPFGCPALAQVNQATSMHSPDHSTKGTPSALGLASRQWPLTAGKYEVSGSLSSPFRGAFHLSLTVLVHYRSHGVSSLGGWSPLLPTSFLVARGTQEYSRGPLAPRYRTLTVSGRAFQPVRVSSGSCCAAPTTPPSRSCEREDGLGWSRFARHYYGTLV